MGNRLGVVGRWGAHCSDGEELGGGEELDGGVDKWTLAVKE
jgi:hypothetical protein